MRHARVPRAGSRHPKREQRGLRPPRRLMVRRRNRLQHVNELYAVYRGRYVARCAEGRGEGYRVGVFEWECGWEEGAVFGRRYLLPLFRTIEVGS